MGVADWRALGCVRAPKVDKGRAAWRVTAPRSAPTMWRIVAAHCPYLGRAPHAHGPDAWRISVQQFGARGWTEHGHRVAESEAQARDLVAYLIEEQAA